MAKINLFGKVLKSRLFRHFCQSAFRDLGVGLLLLAGFQLTALKAESRWDEPTLNNQNFENQVSSQDIRELKPGETVERQAQFNEIHAYQIYLEAGTSVEINFGKRDMSFQVMAIQPDNKDYLIPGQKIPISEQLSRVSVGFSGELVEPMVIIAEKTGKYIVKMEFPEAGAYSFSCSLPHTTTERDIKYAGAGKLFAEIRQAYESEEPIQKVSLQIEERVALYRSLNDPKSVALSLNDLALLYVLNAESGKALKGYNEALDIFRSLKSTANIINNLHFITGPSIETGDFQAAIDSYTELLSLYRATGNKDEEANALHNFGVVYHLLADEQKARELYEQSLLIRKSTTPITGDNLNGQAVSLINIGNLYRGVEGNEIVLESFGPRTMDDRRKALEYYQQSLELARRIKKEFPGQAHREAYNLLQIGNTYKELGNYPEALVYLNQAFDRYKSSKSIDGRVYCLMALGNLYALKGEYQKSFESYEQVIELLKTAVDNNNYYKTRYLNTMAKDYYRAGETQKALNILEESLNLSRSKEQRVFAAASLFEMAVIERDLGNFSNARNRIEEAIQTVEALRTRMMSQEIRTTFFSSVKRYYDFYVDLLMQTHKSQPEKGFDRVALQMSEKARSRSLLDLLTLSRIDIKEGVDPVLLEQEKSVRERLTEKANQQDRLLLRKHTPEEAEKMKAEVSNLTAEYESVQTEIKNKSPRYAALTQPTPLEAGQIQRLLDSGTVLLEYSLGEKKSYLWVVSADSITSFDLPKREEIEARARRVYELLTARNQTIENEADTQKRTRIKTAEEEYTKAAAELSRMLIAPALSQLGNKRLVIVPDGTLNYLPFSALSSWQNTESVNPGQPLGLNHEIITLPSASILALLRKETLNRKPAPKMLAVFADPIFNQTDVRFNPGAAGRAKTKVSRSSEISQSNNQKPTSSFSRDFERAITDVGLVPRESGGLPRLPFSRREADSIYKVSPQHLSFKKVDFEASKTRVFNSNLEQYRILHFATHGLLNSQHPELSGVVLSLIDETGREIDGFVRLQDIYNLRLSPDLVVLSACNTALGKDVKGEGLIGLTRGFMYAGTPRVVASLWKVDDAATAELMNSFYRRMLVENLRPAAALRAAQIEMMKQTRWKSPYYWAPFIIQGEWK